MWIDDFVECLFSNDQKKINAPMAAKLKYEHFPAFLCQYMSFDENGYSLESLKENKIFLSDPTKFNDPYDSAFMMTNFRVDDKFIKQILSDDPTGFRKNYKLTKRELSKLIKSNNVITDFTRFMAKKDYPEYRNDLQKIRKISKEYDDQFRKMELNINKLKRELGVTCFSETYESILMWSHYAKDHTGCCVKYDFKSLGHKHHLTRNIFPVIYTKEIFPIDEHVHQSMYNKNAKFKNVLSSFLIGINVKQLNVNGPPELSKEKTKFNNMFYVYVALNKYEGWKYEKEWRYVITYKKELKSQFIDVPKPKAIYLGAKAADENKDAILEIGKDKNIDVYQMHMESSEFALRPKKIS